MRDNPASRVVAEILANEDRRLEQLARQHVTLYDGLTPIQQLRESAREFISVARENKIKSRRGKVKGLFLGKPAQATQFYIDYYELDGVTSRPLFRIERDPCIVEYGYRLRIGSVEQQVLKDILVSSGVEVGFVTERKKITLSQKPSEVVRIGPGMYTGSSGSPLQETIQSDGYDLRIWNVAWGEESDGTCVEAREVVYDVNIRDGDITYYGGGEDQLHLAPLTHEDIAIGVVTSAIREVANS